MTLWSERDGPVLVNLLETPPPDNMLATNWRSESARPGLKMNERQFHLAVARLHDAGFVSYESWEWEGSGGVYWMNFFVTGRGKQALGYWPLFDALGDPGQLADLLDRLAADAPTEEEASNLRRAATLVRRVGPPAIKAALKGVIIGYAKAHGL
jgi:hypothetical protein